MNYRKMAIIAALIINFANCQPSQAQSPQFCLAQAIYHEARGEPLEGQIAVGHVVLNRAKRWNISICDVVYQPKQFSNISIRKFDYGSKDWFRVSGLSVKLMRNMITDNTNGALYFLNKHDVSVTPAWLKGKVFSVRYGDHWFYK